MEPWVVYTVCATVLYGVLNFLFKAAAERGHDTDGLVSVVGLAVAVLALAKVGLVRVSINTGFKGASLAYPFEAFAPRALIADAAHAEVLAEALPAGVKGAVEMTLWRGGAQDDFAALYRWIKKHT